MDDFGTGYSGLSQIAHLPLDALKIDRAFIAGMTISTEHMAIVSAIINLANALQIHPAIVAGRVRHEQKNYRLLSQFVGSGGDALRVGHGSVWLCSFFLQEVWRLPLPPVGFEKSWS